MLAEAGRIPPAPRLLLSLLFTLNYYYEIPLKNGVFPMRSVPDTDQDGLAFPIDVQSHM